MTDKVVRCHDCGVLEIATKCDCDFYVTHERASELVQQELGEWAIVERTFQGVKQSYYSNTNLLLHITRAELHHKDKVESAQTAMSAMFEYQDALRGKEFEEKWTRILRDFRLMASKCNIRHPEGLIPEGVVTAALDDSSGQLNGFVPAFPPYTIRRFDSLQSRYQIAVIERDDQKVAGFAKLGAVSEVPKDALPTIPTTPVTWHEAGVGEVEPPAKTEAERQLELNHHHVYGEALLASEWALWKLSNVFGMSADRILDALHKFKSGELFEASWIFVGTLGKDITTDTINLFAPALLCKDVQKETAVTSDLKYKITREWEFRRHQQEATAEIRVWGLVPILREASPFAGNTLEQLTKAIIGNRQRLAARAKQYLKRWMPKLTDEQALVKRDVQRQAIKSENIKSITAVRDREVIKAWIEQLGEKSYRKIADELGDGFSKSTVENIMTPFLDKCAEKLTLSKSLKRPYRDFEAFTARVIEDVDYLDDDAEIALALNTGGEKAFGGAHIQESFHARSFNTYGRLWYRATASSGDSAERGMGGDSYWSASSDDNDEFDGQ